MSNTVSTMVNGIEYRTNGKAYFAKVVDGKVVTIKKEEYNMALETLQQAEEQEKEQAGQQEQVVEKKERGIQGYKKDGTYTIITRNDNRIRLLNGAGQTIAMVQIGKRKCYIHTAKAETFGPEWGDYRQNVEPYEAGPNHYRLAVTREDLNETVHTLFGMGEAVVG